MFADIDFWDGMKALVVLLIGGPSAGFLGWYLRHKQEDRKESTRRNKTALAEWQDIVTRLDRQMVELQRANDECRRRETHFVQCVTYLHGRVRALEEIAKSEGGVNISPIEPLERLLGDISDDFKARQDKQSSVLLHEEVKRVTPDPKGS